MPCFQVWPFGLSALLAWCLLGDVLSCRARADRRGTSCLPHCPLGMPTHPPLLCPPPAPPAERAALANMIARFGSVIFASVMDSYDYERVGGSLNNGLNDGEFFPRLMLGL